MRFIQCGSGHDAHSRGFSLVELLVAVTIFTMVILVAVGALITLLDANLKTRNQKLVFNNLNVAVESMVRTIRSGENYTIGNSSGPGTQLSLTNSSGDSVVYERVIDSVTGNGKVVRRVNGAAAVDVTPNNLNVMKLSFEKVAFSGNLSSEFDKVLISINGLSDSGDGKTESEFTLQTTVSKNAKITIATPLTPKAINNLIPYCAIPDNVPGIDLLVEFEADKYPSAVLFDRETIEQSACDDVSLPFDCDASRRRITGEGWNYKHYDATSLDSLGNPLGFPLPGGEYEVYLAGWDDHCDDQFADGSVSGCYRGLHTSTWGSPYPGGRMNRWAQDGEQMLAEITLSDGSTIRTQTTPDIPCGENFLSGSNDIGGDEMFEGAEYTALGDTGAGPCVNFHTNPADMYVGNINTSNGTTDLTIDSIRVYHEYCDGTAGDGDPVCEDINDRAGITTAYYNDHSIVPACIGFICTGGSCLSGGAGVIQLPDIEI